MKVRNHMVQMLATGGIWSLLFVIRYLNARSNLWAWWDGGRQRIPGRMMLPFGELIHGVFLAMAVAALGYVIYGVFFYLSHYQGSRSIYTMRRLPDRWELWRRCLTFPAVFLLLSALCTLILLGLYYLLWRFATPPDALPL